MVAGPVPGPSGEVRGQWSEEDPSYTDPSDAAAQGERTVRTGPLTGG